MFLEKIGFPVNNKPVPTLDLKLSSSELETGKETLKKITNNNKRTICIFTYATGAKCYSQEWWEDFYDALIEKFGDYNVIEVLPVENVSRINFKAPTFYSENVREIGALISNTTLFIGADSGIMHLASAAGTPTIGLFSVTNPKVYEPYNDNSLAIETNNRSVTDCVKIIEKIMTSL